MGPIIAEILGAYDVNIAGLQGVGQLDKDANLKRAPAENDWGRPTFDEEALPSLRRKTKTKSFCQIIATCVAVPDHDRQSVQQAAILGRRSDIHQLKQAEQQIPCVRMNRPKQWQVVVVNRLSDDLSIVDVLSRKAIKAVPVGRGPALGSS